MRAWWKEWRADEWNKKMKGKKQDLWAPATSGKNDAKLPEIWSPGRLDGVYVG